MSDEMSEGRVKIRARYSGDRKVCYRWVGAIDGLTLTHAQRQPGAEVVEDTWSSQVDDRISRKTVVRLPVGLLVLDSTHERGDHAYTAGILAEDPARPGVGLVDWSRARWVETIDPDKKRRVPRTHVIEVDGRRRVYSESR